MSIRNESGVPTAAIEKALRFCSRYSRFSVLTNLLCLRSSTGHVGGKAYKKDPRGAAADRPSLVALWLPTPDQQYPKTLHHVAEVGPIQVWSWEEEVTVVLAHELRHIDQFWDKELFFSTAEEHEAEVDAETNGVRVLGRLRASKRRRA